MGDTDATTDEATPDPETPEDHAQALALEHEEHHADALALKGKHKQANQRGGTELVKLRSKVQELESEKASIENDPFYESKQAQDEDLREVQRRLDRAEEDLAAEEARWEERVNKLGNRLNEAQDKARQKKQELEKFCERHDLDPDEYLSHGKD